MEMMKGVLFTGFIDASRD